MKTTWDRLVLALGLLLFLLFTVSYYSQSPVPATASESTLSFASISDAANSDASVIPCYFVGGVCSRGRYEFLGQGWTAAGKWTQEAPRTGSYWVRFVVGDTVVSTEFIEGSMR